MIHAGHEHDWITNRLAVGSAVVTHDDLVRLPFEGITHVLDLRSTREGEALYRSVPIITYLCLPSADDGTPRTLEWVRDGVQFASEALRKRGKVLVHCTAGVNRSPSMAYAI